MFARRMFVWVVICLAALSAGCVSITATAQAPAAAQLSLLRGSKPPVATRFPSLETLINNAPKQRSTLGRFSQPGDAPTAAYNPAAAYVPAAAGQALPINAAAPTPLPPFPEGVAAPAGLNAPLADDWTTGSDPANADVSAVVRLVIPKMGLDTVVKYVPFSGDTWLIGDLAWEIAWMGDTSWPGLGGNTALAAHVDFADGSRGPFWNLNTLQPGDSVEVYTLENRYTYTMSTAKVVDERDLSVIAPTDAAQITMITCAGWDPARGAYVQRLVVTATLSSVTPLQ